MWIFYFFFNKYKWMCLGPFLKKKKPRNGKRKSIKKAKTIEEDMVWFQLEPSNWTTKVFHVWNLALQYNAYWRKNDYLWTQPLPVLIKSERPKSITFIGASSSLVVKRKFCRELEVNKVICWKWEWQLDTMAHKHTVDCASRRLSVHSIYNNRVKLITYILCSLDYTSGFRSRCTTPWRWQKATTFRICTTIALASSSLYLPPL